MSECVLNDPSAAKKVDEGHECAACGAGGHVTRITEWSTCAEQFPATSGALVCVGCAGRPNQLVDEMIRSRRAAKDQQWTPKVGDRVRTSESSRLGVIRGRSAKVKIVGTDRCTVALDRAVGPSQQRVWEVAIADLEPDPVVSLSPDFATGSALDAIGEEHEVRRRAGETDAAYRDRVFQLVIGLGAAKPDPYAAHHAWTNSPEGRAALMTQARNDDAKRAQALAQLKAPLFGKMGDRDRYGQKVSLKGWPETDDGEP